MASNPFFSIIIVSLNAGSDMKITLDSVLSQDFDDYEIIIKDGVSTDNTLRFIPINSKIKVISEKDTGIFDAMNYALDFCSGRYVNFLNCGDCFMDNSLLGSLSKWIISEKSPNIVYGDAVKDKMLCRFPRKASPFFLYRTSLIHQACFYKKEVFDLWGKYDLNYKICADTEHIIRTVIYHSSQIKHYNGVVCYYKGGGYSERPELQNLLNIEAKAVRLRYYSSIRRMFYKLVISLTLKNLRVKIVGTDSPLFLRKVYRSVRNFIYQ